uniref:PH domain-containing protein n=1 Tax=Romanomermis culicivorax TaxID=13658 RepID=A0A915HL50_ROMCU
MDSESEALVEWQDAFKTIHGRCPTNEEISQTAPAKIRQYYESKNQLSRRKSNFKKKPSFGLKRDAFDFEVRYFIYSCEGEEAVNLVGKNVEESSNGLDFNKNVGDDQLTKEDSLIEQVRKDCSSGVYKVGPLNGTENIKTISLSRPENIKNINDDYFSQNNNLPNSIILSKRIKLCKFISENIAYDNESENMDKNSTGNPNYVSIRDGELENSTSYFEMENDDDSERLLGVKSAKKATRKRANLVTCHDGERNRPAYAATALIWLLLFV